MTKSSQIWFSLIMDYLFKVSSNTLALYSLGWFHLLK